MVTRLKIDRALYRSAAHVLRLLRNWNGELDSLWMTSDA